MLPMREPSGQWRASLLRCGNRLHANRIASVCRAGTPRRTVRAAAAAPDGRRIGGIFPLASVDLATACGCGCREFRAPLGAAHCGALDVRRLGCGICDPIESSPPSARKEGTPRSERGSESSPSRHEESCDRGHLSAGDFLRERRSRESGQRHRMCVCFFPRDFCKWWRVEILLPTIESHAAHSMRRRTTTARW